MRLPSRSQFSPMGSSHDGSTLSQGSRSEQRQEKGLACLYGPADRSSERFRSAPFGSEHGSERGQDAPEGPGDDRTRISLRPQEWSFRRTDSPGGDGASERERFEGRVQERQSHAG